jgi:hypothetical protein
MIPIFILTPQKNFTTEKRNGSQIPQILLISEEDLDTDFQDFQDFRSDNWLSMA